MEEDTWTEWVIIAIVGALLGLAGFLVADSATHASGRAAFLGIMSGLAYLVVALRR